MMRYMSRDIETIRIEFGRHLRYHRKTRLYSQESLALECDLSWRFVQDIERGLKQPTIATLFKLAEVLEMSPCELITPAWEMWQTA